LVNPQSVGAILPHRRELLADGRPVKLGGRAFDMLMALIDARGEVISKDALMARVWPDRVVEEKNLHTQIFWGDYEHQRSFAAVAVQSRKTSVSSHDSRPTISAANIGDLASVVPASPSGARTA
jgi:hypothetical protein